MSETTKVSLYGVGGAGINILKKFINEVAEDFVSDLQSIVAIDTSESNLSNANFTQDNCEIIKLAVSGSGKDRKKNYDTVIRQMDNYDFNNLADINIIISSLAGGTGSLIANLLATRCQKNNKCTINMCILDTSSAKSCFNTIEAIRTFKENAEQYKHYYPLMLYSNKEGRRNVDKCLVNDLINLAYVFNYDIEEIDHFDKIHFLRPIEIDNSLYGTYSMGVINSDTFNTISDDSEPIKGANIIKIDTYKTIHAIMAINPDGIVPENITALVDYVGITEDEKDCYTLVNGVAIDVNLVKELRLKADSFKEKRIEQTDLSDINELNI